MSISITALTYSYGLGFGNALDKLSFTADDAEVTAILGPNGAGKTTLFRCILGLNGSYGGKIDIDGKSAASLSAKELAGLCAYIPQSYRGVFDYTVEEMTLMGTTGSVQPLSSPKANELKAARMALERCGIAHLGQRSFMRLSGGERQLVLIARAIAQRSRTLIMDEPTANLDFGNQTMVMELCRSLAREGYAILLSTHNPMHALWYANKAVAIKNGSAIACGSPDEVMDEQLIRALYSVEASIVQTERGTAIFPGRDNV